MDNNVNVLDELNKGATMGMDAIKYVYDKVGDSVFKKVLDGEYRKYKEVADRIAVEYDKFSIMEPHSTNMMTKAMSWYGIQMRTMVDQSDSKIAELLLQGTNMGIIEGRRLLNHKSVDKEVDELLNKYVNMQEEIISRLKDYL